MVTEVPDYLLQRSRERRAALGLGGGDPDAGGSVADAGGGDAGGAPATTSAASSTPAVAAPQPIAPGTPDPEPQPDPPNVVAARARKKMPVWALAVFGIGVPLWGYAYAGTLEPPTNEELTAQELGGEVYSNCSSCHGGGGEGGSGPAFGAVGETFPDPTDHAHWVFLGSTGWQEEVGDTYGATEKPVSGGMPAWGTSLTPEELMEVVIYERAEFGELDVEAEGLVDEEGNLLVTFDEEQGVLVDIASGEPAEITPEG
jgi:hypothetical protein